MALVQAKKELRKRMRSVLTGVSPESIARQSKAMPDYPNGKKRSRTDLPQPV